jgi:LysM repeat protein
MNIPKELVKMKIVRIFGVVLALHVVGGILFIQPGCQSKPRPEAASTIPATGEPIERLDWDNWEMEDSLAANERPRTTPTRPTAQPGTSLSGEESFLRPLAPLEPLPSFTSTPSAPTSSDTNISTYTVRGGDSLWSIANRNGISLAALLSANGLTESSVIQPGQELRIPGSTASSRPASAASSPAGATPPSGTTTYVVRSGDSLSIIARRHNTTVSGLKALNNMTSDMIRIDQKLIVPTGPSGGAPSAATATRAPAAPTGGGQTHTVQAGETPGGIAAKYGVSVSDLMSLNGISDPRRMRLGQSLVIPGTGPSATGNSAVSTSTSPAAPQATTPGPAPSQPARTSGPRDIPVLPADDEDEELFPIIPIIPSNR